MKKELAIIIPVYNEEAAISEVIAQWTPVAEKNNGRIIVINDGSKDKSKEIIQNLITQGSPIDLIDQKNQGHGQSCLNGYQQAIDRGYNWVFQTDSDGQTSPKDFELFWNNKEESPIIFGQRHNRGDGICRKIISFILKMIILFMFGKYIKDANVPFRLIRTDLLANALNNFPQNLFLANAYLSVKLAKSYPIKWLPIHFANRSSGTPSIRLLNFFSVGVQVIKEFSQMNSKEKPIFPIEIFTICYLILPYFLFMLGWLHWWISIPLSTLLIYTLHKVTKRYSFSISGLSLNPRIILIIIISALWVYFSGAGALSYQNGDYQKHNAMLFDLTSMQWPITYKTPLDFLNLVYYLGHYLVAGLLGKMFGILIAHKIFFLWTLGGVYLALYWFFKLAGKTSILLLLFFIFFSGLDVVGTVLMKADHAKIFTSGTSHIEWWAGFGFWQYSSNTAALYWTPQHVIPAWLISSLIISNRGNIPVIFLFALSALWSPFVMLGLIPLLFIDLKQNLKKIITIETLTGFLLLILMGFFYKSNLLNHRSHFLWNQYNLLTHWPLLLLFYFLEFGIFYIIIGPYCLKKYRKLSLISLIVLLLIPLYQFGHFNDFGMRSSLPAIFIMQILIARYLLAKKNKKALLITCLFVGSITAAMEISRSLNFHPHRHHKQKHVTQVLAFVASQYMGANDSFFFKYLAKKSESKIEIPKDVLNRLPR